MEVHNKESLKEFRRALRQTATPAEYMMWQQIRNGKLNGLKFKRQHSIGNYIVDFYCASKRLVIELDGGIHNRPEQQEKDKYRDEHLTEMDFRVLRFKNEEVLGDFNSVKEQILNL